MKVGIFYLLCGGGHLSASKAVQSQCQQNYSGTEVKILEAKSSSRLVGWMINTGYALAINRISLVWRFLYWFYTRRVMVSITAFVFSHFFYLHLRETLLTEKFDRVVSTHFFLTPALVTAVRRMKLNVKVFCIVTDPFTVPPYWFLKKNVNYLVFSQPAKLIGLRAGVANEQIKVFSPLINPNLEIDIEDKLLVRANLGLSAIDQVILVVGGGNGLSGGVKIVQALCEEFVHPNKSKETLSVRIIVVCGHDQGFYDQVKKIQEKFPLIADVFGFVDLAKIMPVADMVVGKAGPAVVFESLFLKKPIVLSSYVWKQEKGNVDYVVENGVGYYEPKIRQLTSRVREILFDKNLSTRLLENIEKLNIKNGVAEVTRHIIEE